MTGPITFAHETARTQLREGGEVVTFRKKDRTTGKTWWRSSRTGPQRGAVRVEQIGECDPSDLDELEPHADLSGFDTAASWQVAITVLNDGELPESGYLYRVTNLGPGRP